MITKTFAIWPRHYREHFRRHEGLKRFIAQFLELLDSNWSYEQYSPTMTRIASTGHVGKCEESVYCTVQCSEDVW